MNIVKKVLNCNFDYRTSRDECDCRSMCRCSEIKDASFETAFIYPYDIKKLKKDHSTIDAYCIERIIKKQILDSSRNISPTISRGYYGEEISGWTHPNTTTANQKIKEVLDLPSKIEKIHMVLMYEYQYIPDHILEYDTTSIKTHSVDKIKKLNFSGMIKNYDYETSIHNDHIPIGILNSQQNIIDGYHRIANCSSKEATFIELSR